MGLAVSCKQILHLNVSIVFEPFFCKNPEGVVEVVWIGGRAFGECNHGHSKFLPLAEAGVDDSPSLLMYSIVLHR